MKRNSAIEAVGEVDWGTHLCLLYETTGDILEILVPYFRAGLENNELCVWAISKPLSIAQARERLAGVVPDLTNSIAEGKLRLVDSKQIYGRLSPLNAAHIVQGWVEQERQALKDGFDGVRAAGEVFYRKGNWPAVARYERAFDEVADGLKVIVVCCYPVRKLCTARIIEGGDSHDGVILRRKGNWALVENRPGLRRLTEKRLKESEQRCFNAFVTERKKAEDELKRSRETLRALSARLESLQEEEKERIARELHDEFGTAFTSLKMDLFRLAKSLPDGEWRGRVSAMLKLVESSLEAVHRISYELRPRILDDLGLAVAIEWQAMEFQKRTGIRCKADVGSYSGGERRIETALFRICQEALTNVARHARASTVKIVLRKQDRRVLLTVGDNGRGITPVESGSPASLGINGMRERAMSIGGACEVSPGRAGGTRVKVRIPIETGQKSDDKNTGL